jgi:hypothetical protein
MGSRRTNPFARLRVAPVSHRHSHRADHGVQRQFSRLPLVQGEKRARLISLRLQPLLQTLARPFLACGQHFRFRFLQGQFTASVLFHISFQG